MGRVIFVEVRDPRGVTTARLRLTDEEITIGRGPDNLVVLNDEYVDAAHLRVVVPPDGQTAVFRDVDSTNGTTIEGALLNDDEVAVPFGTPVLVGRTTVILSTGETSVAEAKMLPDQPPRLVAYERLPAWASAFVVVGYLTVRLYWSSFEPMGPGELAGLAIMLFIFLMLWAGGWAAGSRILAGAGHFRQHLAFASFLGLTIMPLGTFLGWVSFAVGNPIVDFVINWGIFGVGVWALMLFGHLDIASRRNRRFKAGLAIGLAASFIGVVGLFSRIDLTPREEIQRSLTRLQPVPTRFTRSGSLGDFLEGLEGMEAALEEEAARERDK